MIPPPLPPDSNMGNVYSEFLRSFHKLISAQQVRSKKNLKIFFKINFKEYLAKYSNIQILEYLNFRTSPEFDVVDLFVDFSKDIRNCPPID